VVNLVKLPEHIKAMETVVREIVANI